MAKNGHSHDDGSVHSLGDCQKRLLDAVEPALALPEKLPVEQVVLPPGMKISHHPVASRNVTWLTYCGLRPAQIAEKTGLPITAIMSFTKSAAFHDLYDKQLSQMLAKTDETMKTRLQSIVVEAIETKIWLMRNATREALQNQIASELITLGREIMQLGRGTPTDLLKAIHEQAVKEGKDGSRTTTQRVTLSGDPAIVAAALQRSGGPSDGAAGDRPTPPSDDRPGEGGAGAGAPQVTLPPGEPGDHGDDSSGGL